MKVLTWRRRMEYDDGVSGWSGDRGLASRDRGKSALHRARRRIAPGAGTPPLGANLPEKGHRKQTALSARSGSG